MSGLLRAALALASGETLGRACPVFPLKVGDKTPMIPKSAGGRGLLDAVCDLSQIREWWTRWPEANVGHALAEDLAVVDVEGPSHGQDRDKVITAIEAARGQLPPTRTVETAGGGRHFIYRLPAGSITPTVITTRGGEEIEGVEVRRHGMYIVAPPSVRNGSSWLWSSDLPIAAAPSYLVAVKPTPRPPGERDAYEGSGHGTPYGLAGLRGEVEGILAALPGHKRVRVYAAAAAVAELSAAGQLDEQHAIDELLAAARGTYAGEWAENEADAVRAAHDGWEKGWANPRAVPTPDDRHAPPPVPAMTLEQVLAVYERWLYLEDTDAVIAALGAVAANLAPGDPVWLLVVAPPGHGKTEVIAPLRALPNVHPAAVLSEASLLSGTPKREAKDAKGGLLREVGGFGVILCKDFTSILSMHRDARAQVIAALREIYDGAWTRHVGSDGGRTLHWEGKVGLVAGCTPTIDRHHAVMGAMGERFVLYRMPEIAAAKAAKAALAAVGHEEQMRRELQDAVRGLFAGELADPPALSDAEQDRLIALASLSVRARSAVERDGYSREIEMISGAESPTRLVKVLAGLVGGMLSIGAGRETAWRIVTKAALDCVPAIRWELFGDLAAKAPEPVLTKDLASARGYPTTTAHRALEDLAVYGLVERVSGGPGKGDRWAQTSLGKRLLEDAQGPNPKSRVRASARKKEKEEDPLTPSTDISGTPAEPPSAPGPAAPRCPSCQMPFRAREPGDPTCRCNGQREEAIEASLFDGTDDEFAERLTPEGLPWPDNWDDGGGEA